MEEKMKRIARILALALIVAVTFSMAFLAWGSEWIRHPCERSEAAWLYTGLLTAPIIAAQEDARCKEQMTPEQYQAWKAHQAQVVAERDAELECEMFGNCD